MRERFWIQRALRRERVVMALTAEEFRQRFAVIFCTADKMHDAFKAEVHYLQVNGILHRGNEQVPLIPGIANAIVDVMSRNYFRPNPANTGVTSAVIDPAFRTIVERNTANGVNPQLTRECIVFTCRCYSFAGLQKR